VRHPDILIVEGLNVLQPARAQPTGATSLAVSDFFDFSVYVDADESDLRSWYLERFMGLRESAFKRPPQSYFSTVRRHDATPRRAIWVRTSGHIWDTINGPNLRARTSCRRGGVPRRSCAS
jgi:type I pantothenate kinase